MIIPLQTVVYDERARDGTWCRLHYPNHPRGCPNFPDCINTKPDFKDLPPLNWYAVIEEFDLQAHAEKMKEKHPHWSERQARNLLYWQGGVRKRLREKTNEFAVPLMGDVVLEIPEACGVNIFATMAKHGIVLERNPDLVRKIMIVGKKHQIHTSNEKEE